jgi:alginate O-acetyltransferase complex protein AlgJ
MKYPTATGAQRALAGLVATVFVFGPAVVWALGGRPHAIENRALLPAPDVRDGWGALDKLSPWATDHLPGRARAVHLSAWVDFRVLGQLPSKQEVGPKGMTMMAPSVVRGTDGYLFLGQEFTRACAWTPGFGRSLKSISHLAEIIEASGRKVVFTVAPNKSSVASDKLPRVMPRGDCAILGIAKQNQLLDSFRNPLFVGIRKPLAEAHAAGKQVFPRTDSHWATLGGAILAQAVAGQLDPALAPRLRLEPDQITGVGDLKTKLGLTSPELVTSASLSSGATVFPHPEQQPVYGQTPAYHPDSWVTRPTEGLVQGRTLLLGDSFTGASLESLRPLFAQGRFVSFSHMAQGQLISEIASSDTVVIEVVQRNVVGGLCAQPKFQKRVATALGVPAR